MVTVSPDAKEQFPIFFRWMNGGFYGSVAYNDRIMTAFFKWSNFSDSYDSRTYFKYGTPPLIGLISGSRACRYNSDGTPTGVYYGMTWSVDKIGRRQSATQVPVDLLHWILAVLPIVARLPGSRSDPRSDGAALGYQAPAALQPRRVRILAEISNAI